MNRRGEREPEALANALEAYVRRFRRVDVNVMAEINERWPDLVGRSIAERCRPEIVRDGVLLIGVPSGAFAERLELDAEAILAAFADLGERAPTALRCHVR